MALGENYVTVIVKRSLIVLLIATGICLVFFDNPIPYVYGLLFGGIINILGFKLIELGSKRAVQMSEGKAKAQVTFNYMVRYIIYAIVLAIAAKAEYIDLVATIVSLFLVKLVIIADSVYDTIKG